MFQQLFNVVAHGKLTVLLFHKVPRQRHPLASTELDLAGFERVLQTTMRLFNILPLEDALTALRAGNLPPRAACITFDDGYPDWLKGVVPVLQKHNAHATFFITSGQFSGLPMWNERILHAVAAAPGALPELQLGIPGVPPLGFASDTERHNTIRQLDRALKYQAPQDKERLLLGLERHTGHNAARVPVMCGADLRALHAKGFGIGGHAVTHPILSRCTPEQAYQEIAGAREALEALVRGKVLAFAYPNGIPHQDFGPEHIDMVKRAGYTSAVTTHRGAATAETSRFQIPRFTPWGPSAAKIDLQFARNFLQKPTLLAEAEAPGKRVLMVAFHFPPQAGSSGILRTLNFVKYLPQFGWQPSVLTAKPKAYVEQRNDLVASIPQQTRMTRAMALDAARHLSIFGKYPRIFALPDRWSSWWLPAVVGGMREIRRERPGLIWSTYPISTAHLIGATLARLSGLPWVADFRDPMVSADYPADRWQRGLWRWLEARVLRQAVACVFTTERAAIEYAQRYPACAHKCKVIENGYDEEAFTHATPNRRGAPETTRLMLHSGLIYPQDRDPSTFFAAVRALLDEGRLDQGALCIRFRAPQHGEEVMACARAQGVDACVEIAPPLPYQEAIAEMLAADLLLVFQGSHFNAQIPAKIYEYLRAHRPLLAVLDPAGDTASKLKQFSGTYIADIANPHFICREMERYLGRSPSEPCDQERLARLAEVGRYSRISQSSLLADCLSGVDHKPQFGAFK